MQAHASEEVEQIALFQWARYAEQQFPELALLHHIPNGGKRSKSEAARFKAAGVKAGVPDIELPVARGGYFGLHIELKAGKNKTTVKQDEWLQALREQGRFCAVCYGWTEAMHTICAYLAYPPTEPKEEYYETENSTSNN